MLHRIIIPLSPFFKPRDFDVVEVKRNVLPPSAILQLISNWSQAGFEPIRVRVVARRGSEQPDKCSQRSWWAIKRGMKPGREIMAAVGSESF